MPTGYTVDEDTKKRIIEAHVKHKIAVSELAKGYGVNRKTIHKWLKEVKKEKEPMSTEPKEPTTPAQTNPTPEAPETPPEQPETPEPPKDDTEQHDNPAQVLADAQEQADKLVAAAKAQAEQILADAAADANATRTKALAEADLGGGEPAEEEVDCPNPSCAAQFAGNECPNCGFRHDAAVRQITGKAK